MHLAVDPSSPMPPLFHSPPARKPGRSLGAKARVVQDARALGIHHFAFVRLSFPGIYLLESFERYLAWSETITDLRYVQNRRDALLKSIIEAGRHFDATLPETAKITQLLDLLRSDATVKPAVVFCPVWKTGCSPKAWIRMPGVRKTCWLNTKPTLGRYAEMCIKDLMHSAQL